MTDALYGPEGFFMTGDGARRHFRTSALTSSLFATALLRLVAATDEALGRPARLDLVDVGAGSGRLLGDLSRLAPVYLARRMRLRGVDLGPRPDDLPPHIEWSDELPPPGSVTGLMLATEWLDNVPLEVAEVDTEGVARYVQVDPRTGEETLGAPLTPADVQWARTWWEQGGVGSRIELGSPRDAAWADAVACLAAGLAVMVDYGHMWYARPRFGTLSGFRAGRGTAAVLDGAHDVTAHVAVDAVCAAGESVARRRAMLTTQRQALTSLGLDGARPPLSLATEDPAEYVRALSQAGEAAELVAAHGLGGHFWILQPVRMPIDLLPSGLRP